MTPSEQQRMEKITYVRARTHYTVWREDDKIHVLRETPQSQGKSVLPYSDLIWDQLTRLQDKDDNDFQNIPQ